MITKNITPITLPNNLGIVNQIDFSECLQPSSSVVIGYIVGFNYADGIDYQPHFQKFFDVKTLFPNSLTLSQDSGSLQNPSQSTEQEGYNAFITYTSIQAIES